VSQVTVTELRILVNEIQHVKEAGPTVYGDRKALTFPRTFFVPKSGD